MAIVGVIDDVVGGMVFGRIYDYDGSELLFEVPLLDVLECQRVDLEPGNHCSLVNGHLLIDKTIWTTHETEQADAEALRLWASLNGEAS